MLKEEMEHLLNEGQNPTTVERICSRVLDILISSETIDYVAVQKRLVTNPIPDAVILTNRRFILYKPRLLGRVSFQNYPWRDLIDAHLQEGIIGATLTLQTVDGEVLSIEYLPKSQARRLYGLAQEREERVREERRRRELEDRRAASGGIVIRGDLAGEGSPAPRASLDPVQRLKKLKEMLDAGLISPGEYEAKRADIISVM